LASEWRPAEQERQQAAEQARQAAERDRQAEAERIASAARAQAAAIQQTGQAVAAALGNLIQFFEDKSRERSEAPRVRSARLRHRHGLHSGVARSPHPTQPLEMLWVTTPDGG
jgi:hypothetical protein